MLAKGCAADQRIFVDRDGSHFHYLLSSMRGCLSRAVTDRLDMCTRAQIMEDAVFFGVHSVIGGVVIPPVGSQVISSCC